MTGSGPLSGAKTDMAINVYTPGCHLLCHDDVIGSRRVSYILYLTDPDRPWGGKWGGALRLYPNKITHAEDGQRLVVPSPDHTVSIPPAFNQLSFFAVQPGESFHDVEEVYAQTEGPVEGAHGGRVRIAISGWYHIPQKGEDGYVEGLEAELGEKSSLMQLQGKGDKYDLPQVEFESFAPSIPDNAGASIPTPSSQEDPELTKEDFDFLLDYIDPRYLTPDTLETITETFAENSFLLLDTFLSIKFSNRLHDELSSEESAALPEKSDDIEAKGPWKVARPPHKHRFLYQQPSTVSDESTMNSPLQDLLKNLVPSIAFQKWLQIATGLTVHTNNALARRFRRGQDYTLAQRYDQQIPGLEMCLSLTPTNGWGDDQEDSHANGEDKLSSKAKEASSGIAVHAPEVGGYLAYMAGDEDDDVASDAGSNHGVAVPLDMSTGGRATKAKRPKADPAIYEAQDDDGEDPVLFHMSATWNQLGIVLRDKGTMRFVKYVSRQAKGDRWDVVGEFKIEDPAECSEDEEFNEGMTGQDNGDVDMSDEDNDNGDDDDDDDGSDKSSKS